MSSIVLVVVLVLVLGFCSFVPKLQLLLGNARSARLPGSRLAAIPKQELRRSLVPKRELGNQRRHKSTAARALRIDARGDRKPNRRRRRGRRRER